MWSPSPTEPESRVQRVDGDLPVGFSAAGAVAVDIETSGLDWSRDRIATVQILNAGTTTLVVVGPRRPDRLVALIDAPDVAKIFHHAMFDLRFLSHAWGARPRHILCTKVLSKILDPDAPTHSLGPLVQRHLGVHLEKGLAVSDWFGPLSDAQVRYAVEDVVHLPALYQTLRDKLQRAGRWELSQAALAFLPTQVELDLLGVVELFRH
jgi:ribonuclease D